MLAWFDISFKGLLNFAVGILTGAIIVVYVFFLLFISDNKRKVKIIKSKSRDKSIVEVKNIILASQEDFKNKTKKEKGYVNTALSISLEVIKNISKYYYPESKYPEYELSINEALELNHYITNRVAEMIDRPVVRRVKSLNISTIVDVLNKKKAIEDTKIVKTAKKYKIGKIASLGMTVLNAVNPVYWVKKIIINGGSTFLTKKVCLIIIAIVGEETNNVYSKKIFNDSVDLGLAEEEFTNLLNTNEEEEN